MYVRIPTNQLKAISLFAAKKDTRYYLNGVAINSSHLVATDGHAMAVLPIYDHDKVLISDTINLVIPLESINLYFKGLSAKQINKSETIIDSEKNTLCCSIGGLTIPFTPVDVRYPQWRAILPPDYFDVIPSNCFNWDYLALFQKAAGLLGSKHCELLTRGFDSAKVSIKSCPEFVGVISPIRY